MPRSWLPPRPRQDSMTTDGLKLTEVSSGYERVQVIRKVSLHVSPGESVALLGANGAGKTTLLRTISGLVPASSGRVTFGDDDLTGRSPAHVLSRGIAHVPQGRGMFPSLSVRENLLLGSRGRKNTAQVKADRDYILSVFPALADKLNQSAGDLSGGQQQSLAIGRALMSDPTLLMLDEPSLGLAPRLVEDMSRLLKGVQRDRKMAMLIVEQDALLALELTDRAYLLQRGEVTSTGSSAQLMKDPSVVFAYLGDNVS